MTPYEVREALKNCWRLKKEIRARERLLAELRSRAEKVTPSYSKAPKGGDASSRVESIAILIVEASIDMEERSLELIQALSDAESLIRLEEDAFKRSILTDYHLNGLSVEKIAEKEHYSDRRIWQLMSEAYRDISDRIS